MEYVITFALGMIAATLLIRWMAQRVVDEFMEKFEQAAEEKAEDNQLSVEVEFEQNIYFLYNSDDGSFVAQGNDLLDLRKHLNQRFPDRTIKIVKGDPAVLERLKEQIANLSNTDDSKTTA
jgi:metal-dependent amidase/aminoacylase/carboxypeptidase family protein